MIYYDYGLCIFLDMCDAYNDYTSGCSYTQQQALKKMRELWNETAEQFHTTQMYNECLTLMFKTYNVDAKDQAEFQNAILKVN